MNQLLCCPLSPLLTSFFCCKAVSILYLTCSVNASFAIMVQKITSILFLVTNVQISDLSALTHLIKQTEL